MPASTSIETDRHHLVLHGVSWRTYQSLRADFDDRPLRMTFDQGELEIMAPLPIHEKWKRRLGLMIDLIAIECRLDVVALGSTTFQREDLIRGLEPDECYYVSRAPEMMGRDEIDLAIDPPPDLAIEVDITRRSIPREPIYAALGVPEVWRFDGSKLVILRLQANGVYAVSRQSSAFAFVPMEAFEAFLLRMGSERQLVVLDDFRQWLRNLDRAS